MNSKKTSGEIVRYARLMSRKGYSAALEGNISCRLPGERMLITPTRFMKEFLEEKDLVVIDFNGKVLSGKNRPTSEFLTHAEIYRQKPETRAVVHAHPFFTVLATVLGKNPLDRFFLSEAAMFLKNAVFAPFAKPSTAEGAEVIRKTAAGADVIVIDRHGSFTCGGTVGEAFALLELLEKYCKMDYYAGLSGKEVRYLTEEQVRELGKTAY